MRAKSLIFGATLFLINLLAVSTPQSFAQEATSSESKPAEIALAQFVNDTLKEMNLPGDVAIPGLGDAKKLLLQNFKKANQATFTATVSIKNISFEVVKHTPPGKTKPLLIIGIKKFDLSRSIPGISGTPLGTLGAMENVAFIYSPEKLTGSLSSDAVVKAVLGQVSSRVNLSPGMNLIASVSPASFSDVPLSLKP